MKHFMFILLSTVIYSIGITEVSLAQHQHKAKESVSKHDSSHEQHGKKGSQDIKSMPDTTSKFRVVDANIAASIESIVEYYLQLKNSLANDKPKDAAAAGKEIVKAMKPLDKSLLTSEQKKLYEDIEDDAREHAEHIGENAGNIEHQREHLVMLSNDVYDLVKAFGSKQVLYKDFCPMYNNKKGAMWISEVKPIKNPYYGKKMFTCGSVQEEIK